MAYLYFLYLIIALTSLVGVYLLGTLIITVSKLNLENRYSILFTNLIAGTSLTVILTSLIFTRFNTINLGLILLCGLYLINDLYFNKRIAALNFNGSNFKKAHIPNLLEAGVFLIIVFTFKFLFTIGLYDYPLATADTVFYAKVSDYLTTFGKENITLEHFYSEEQPNSPYHYYELWFNGAVSFLSGKPAIANLLLVTFPLGFLTIWAGFLALYQNLKVKLNLVTKLFLGLLIFIMGIHFPFYSDVPFLSQAINFEMNVFSHPKFFTIYNFLLGALILFLNKRRVDAVLMLLALPIISIATAPGILIGIVGYCIIYFIWLKKDKKEFIQFISYTLFLGCFIAIYYSLNSKNSAQGPGINNLINLSQASIRTSINIIGGGIIHVAILYFPFILLIAYYFRNQLNLKFLISIIKNGFFWLPVSVFLGSLLVWAVLKEMLDAVQLFSNISIPLLNILLVTVFGYILLRTNRKAIFLICTSLLCLVNMGATLRRLYLTVDNDSSYVETVKKTTKNLNPVGVSLKDSSEFNNVFAKNVSVYPLGGYLNFESPKYYTASLSVFEIPLDSPEGKPTPEKKLIENTTFFRFVTKQKADGTFKSVGQSQVDFIRKFKVEYLLTTRIATIPPLISDIATLAATDPVSGERLYLIRKK